MARTSNRLTAMTVQKLKEPGRYADGGGLYLQIGPTGGKSWLFRYTRQGKAREMGLGALNVVSLADAREAAMSVRRTLAAGHDPLETRKAERQQQEAEASGGMTFSECASAYIDAHKSAWRNEKHVAQWSSTIKTYVEPVFGTLPVQAVNLEMVLKVLEPIWQTKPETAARLRGRIESVLDWAAVRGHRSTDNPARWKGHLDKLLPPRSKVQRVQHHAALPFEEIGAFMAELRQREEGAARALEFTILTASRTSEVLNARWEEFDLDAKVWRIPGTRMKAGKDHRVLVLGGGVIAPEMVGDAQTGHADGRFKGISRPREGLELAPEIFTANAEPATDRQFRSDTGVPAVQGSGVVAPVAGEFQLEAAAQVVTTRIDQGVPPGQIAEAQTATIGELLPQGERVRDAGMHLQRGVIVGLNLEFGCHEPIPERLAVSDEATRTRLVVGAEILRIGLAYRRPPVAALVERLAVANVHARVSPLERASTGFGARRQE